MPLPKTLLSILACPDDKSPLNYRQSKTKETLTCTKCHRVFPVIDGIPHLLPKNNE